MEKLQGKITWWHDVSTITKYWYHVQVHHTVQRLVADLVSENLFLIFQKLFGRNWVSTNLEIVLDPFYFRWLVNSVIGIEKAASIWLSKLEPSKTISSSGGWASKKLIPHSHLDNAHFLTILNKTSLKWLNYFKCKWCRNHFEILFRKKIQKFSELNLKLAGIVTSCVNEYMKLDEKTWINHSSQDVAP